MKSKYKAKRLRRWHYLYRGFEIMCVGYYPPEKKSVLGVHRKGWNRWFRTRLHAFRMQTMD